MTKMISKKEFRIMKSIYFKTTSERFCTIQWKEIGQGKRFYQRVKNLEENGIIQVFREVGEPNLYRLTDLGLRKFWETNF